VTDRESGAWGCARAAGTVDGSDLHHPRRPDESQLITTFPWRNRGPSRQGPAGLTAVQPFLTARTSSLSSTCAVTGSTGAELPSPGKTFPPCDWSAVARMGRQMGRGRWHSVVLESIL
jgi:hypothetical protein